MSPLHHDLADRAAELDLHPRTTRNVRMQYRLAVHTLIPWLTTLGITDKAATVCEIGCAEGGVLAAFAERGAPFALGTDIQGALLTQVSAPLWKSLDVRMEFTQHDVIYEDIPDEWRERFDLVILRDVIEHLDDPVIALRNIARLLKPGGAVVVTFPPYTSPFGGHQQLMSTPAGSIPFLHMLPWKIFSGFVRKGDPVNQEEIERLHRIRCSAKGVLAAAVAAGFIVRDERYFALRPVFRWKYEMPIPSFEITSLKMLPYVRSLAMEAAFVLQLPA